MNEDHESKEICVLFGCSGSPNLRKIVQQIALFCEVLHIIIKSLSGQILQNSLTF